MFCSIVCCVSFTINVLLPHLQVKLMFWEDACPTRLLTLKGITGDISAPSRPAVTLTGPAPCPWLFHPASSRAYWRTCGAGVLSAGLCRCLVAEGPLIQRGIYLAHLSIEMRVTNPFLCPFTRDYFITCPVIDMARHWARRAQGNVFMYHVPESYSHGR